MEQIPEAIPSWEATGRSISMIAYLLGAMFVFAGPASRRVGFASGYNGVRSDAGHCAWFWPLWSGYDVRKSRSWYEGNSTVSYRHRILRQC